MLRRQPSGGNERAAASNGRRPSALIRFSHIFASAVRESLEIDLLREASWDSLSVPQFHLLRLITLNGQHQIGEVADFLGVTPPAATKAIDKLEGLGLVKRGPSATDRRVTLLTSTDRARELVARYEALEKARIAPVLDNFEPEEISQFTRLLERFALGLVAGAESDGGLCLRCSAYFDDHCPVHHVTENCPYQKLMTDKDSPEGESVATVTET